MQGEMELQLTCTSSKFFCSAILNAAFLSITPRPSFQTVAIILSMSTRCVPTTHKRTQSVAALNSRFYSSIYVNLSSVIQPEGTITQTRQYVSHLRRPNRTDDMRRGRRIMATQWLLLDEDGSNLGVRQESLRMVEQKNLELVQ